MLGRKAHIKQKGLSCPFCGSLSIQGGFIEIEEGKAFQGMKCTECEAHWQDVYKLIDMEPDAEDINCENCKKVTGKNPLLELGNI